MLSSNERRYIKEAFSLDLPNLENSSCPFFLKLVPQISNQTITSLNFENDDLVSKLSLSFESRFAALSTIKENKYLFNASDVGKKFISIFILQSITPCLLNTIGNNEIEFIRVLIHSLKYSLKISPQYSDTNYKSFSFVYSKCLQNVYFIYLIPDILKYLKLVHASPNCLFQPQVQSINFLIDYIINNPKSNTSTILSHLSLMIPYFSRIKSKSIQTSSLNNLYSNIFDFVKNSKFDHEINIVDIKKTTVRIALELNRITLLPFTQYLTLIMDKFYHQIIPDEEFNLKTNPIQHTEPLSSDQMIKDKDEELNFDDYSLSNIEINFEFLNSNKKFSEITSQINSLPEETIISIIQLMISEGLNEIIKGNLFLQVIIFYLIFYLNDPTQISLFITENNIPNFYITDFLFNPAINIFHSTSETHKKILGLRNLVISSLGKIINSIPNNSDFYLKIILNSLEKYKFYPAMYAELIYHFLPILTKDYISDNSKQEILNSFSNSIQVQQYTKFNDSNYLKIKEIRSLTFNSLRIFVNTLTNKSEIDCSSLICNFFHNILSMIYELSITHIILVLIEHYFSIFFNADPKYILKLISKILDALDNIIKKMQIGNSIDESYNYILTSLLNSLFKIFCGLNPSQIEAIKTTEFFNKIREIVFIKGINIDSIAYALIIDHFAPRRRIDAKWDEICEIISKYEISEAMYQATLILLSHNEEPFIGIANQNSTCLIPFILNSKFNINLLNKINSCLSRSIPDRIIFSEMGLVGNVIKILNEETDDEIWKISLNIIKMTFPYLTRRSDILAFFRLFSPKSPRKQTKHIQELLSTMTYLVIQNYDWFRSVIYFTSKSAYIRLPPLSVTCFHGLAISEKLLISNFQNPKDFIRLVKFTNQQHHLIIDLFSTYVQVSSSLCEPFKLGVEFPINEWFDISFEFKNINELTIFVDKKQFQGEKVPLNISHVDSLTDFTDNILFGGDGYGFVECHLKRAAIFINENEASFPNISNDENLASDPRTYYLIDSISFIKGKVHNLAHNSISYYDCTGQIISNLSSFRATFNYSKGLPFVISLLSQLNYEMPENYNSMQFFLQILEIICILIQMSDSIQDQMVEYKMFEIIAHFMFNSESIEMNFDLSSTIFKIHPIIRNNKLRSSFVRSILLNFPLWKNSSVATLKELFKAWLLATNFIPDVLQFEFRPQAILNVLITLNEKNTFSKEFLDVLFDILIKALCLKCDSNYLTMIFAVMKIRSANPNEIISYLMMLDKFVGKEPSQMKNISEMLIKTKWLVLYSDCRVQNIMIRHFMQSDINLFVQFFVKNIEAASQRKPQENDILLINICFAFFNIDVEIDKIKMDSFTSILKNKCNLDINTILLPLMLSIAHYSSSEFSKNFLHLLEDIFSLSDEKLLIIRESLNDFTILLLISYCIFKEPDSSINFLTKFITLDPYICSQTFKMIDLFTYVTHINYHNFQSNLALKLIDTISEPSFKHINQSEQYIDILINFICFHPRMQRLNKEGSLLDLLSSIKKISINRNSKGTSLKLPKYTFHAIIENGYWIDRMLASHLIKHIIHYKLEKINMSHFMMIVSFFCHPKIKSQSINTNLDKLSIKVPIESNVWTPVLYQVSRHIEDFANAKIFMQSFREKLKLNIDIYTNYCKYFNAFISNFTFDQPLSEAYAKAIEEEFPFVKLSSFKIKTIIEELRKNIEEVQNNYECFWRRLNKIIFYSGSPFFDNNIDNFYKQCYYFDSRLCPSILTRKYVIDNETRTNLSHLNHYNSLSSFQFKINSEFQLNEKSLSSIEAVKSTIKKSTSGNLYITEKCFQFVNSSLKVDEIGFSTITHIFWSIPSTLTPRDFVSFQIFTTNNRCYLFKVHTSNASSIKKYIESNKDLFSNSIFIQMNQPIQEIQKLRLTEKWLSKEITTFTYLIWINMLAGRSFLNKHAYPIFPRIYQNKIENNQKLNEICIIKNYEQSTKLPVSPQIIGECLGIVYPFSKMYLSSTRMKDVFEINHDLPPEFFMNEEFINHDVSLPYWASNNISFCHILQTKLESDDVGCNIGKWIDAIFGIGQATTFNNINEYSSVYDEIPYQIFPKQHPNRTTSIPKPKKNQLSKDDMYRLTGISGNIIGFCTSGTDHKNLMITALLSDGNVVQIGLSQPIRQLNSINKNATHVGFSKDIFFYSYGSTLGLYHINENTTTICASDPVVSKVSSISVNGKYGVTGGADGAVILWKIQNVEKPVFSNVLLIHKGLVPAVAISQEFKCVVSCDNKGIFAISLLPNLELVRTVSVEGFLPRKVIITNGNGTIVLSNESIVSTYTINGNKIQQISLKEKILDICELSNTIGKDYFGVADDTNNIIIYDSYSLSPIKTICINKPIYHIEYSMIAKSFVVTTSSNDSPLIIVPYEIE